MPESNVSVLVANDGLNASNKIFAVPTGKVWEIHGIWAQLVTDATVGVRQMQIDIDDGTSSNLMEVAVAGATQSASLTRDYFFANGLADLTAFRNTSRLTTPLSRTLRLPAGYRIRVYDAAAIAAATDDLFIRIRGTEESKNV